MTPRFYFAACQAGAEKAVKSEILAEFPALRFAFSRPGFITFKEDPAGPEPIAPRRAVFTRLWGEVLGQTRESAAFADLISQIPADAPLRAFDRDLALPGDEPEGFAHDANIRKILTDPSLTGTDPALLRSIAARAEPSVIETIGAPRPGADLYSLIWVDDFHVFLGRHTHRAGMLATAGNIPALTVPAASPSRAWLKIEEAILRFAPLLETGWTALEIGCAPGGATTALLDRGFAVVGVDPQFMDERVATRAGFTHLRKPARFVTADDVRGCNPEWVVMDMSIAPNDALGELQHVVAHLRALHGKTLRVKRGFITLKLTDWKYAAEIPQYLKRLEKLGFRDLRPIQLAVNRQEFFVYAGGFQP